MTLGMDGATRERFDALIRRLNRRGGGVLAVEVDDSGALARELTSDDPDPDRVAVLRARLGLEEPPADEQTSLSLSGRAA